MLNPKADIKNPCKKHPEGTYIDPIHWQYFLGGATASVLQFPVKGAAAMSSHKIQASFLHSHISSSFQTCYGHFLAIYSTLKHFTYAQF